MPYITCENCGKEVYKIPALVKKVKHHFCSRECSAKYRTIKPKVSNQELLTYLKILNDFIFKTVTEYYKTSNEDFDDIFQEARIIIWKQIDRAKRKNINIKRYIMGSLKRSLSGEFQKRYRKKRIEVDYEYQI